MDFAFRPEHLLAVLGVLVQVALAAGVYVLAPRDLRHRAFALLLFLNASWDLVWYVLWPASTTHQAGVASLRIGVFLGILSTGALVAFLCLYPAPRGPMRRRGGFAVLAALTMLGAIAQILMPWQWVVETEGIHASGILVFAMAPLQRAAERLAEKAVPATSGPLRDGGPTSGKEGAYKRALRLALRDRVLTREEDVHLHEVAEHMGIGAGCAMALRVEVEREFARDATRPKDTAQVERESAAGDSPP